MTKLSGNVSYKGFSFIKARVAFAMRIKAEVYVANRGLCEHNVKKPGKSVNSSLAIGKMKKDKDKVDIFMMLFTAQNRAGVKYSCDRENVEKVFTKFVNDGKATIRFKNPPHDLCITKCDVVELKAFLSVMRKVLETKPENLKDLSDLTLSAIQPASLRQVSKSKTKLCITAKKDYPITTGFPHTLTTLQAIGINLRKFDSRIIKLRHLTTLDLSDNAIPLIPRELGFMKCLTELYLARNNIDRLTLDIFDEKNHLSKTLRLLDLSGNRLKAIPTQISCFSKLTTLKIDCNLIERLPASIGKITSLSHLSASHNQVFTLPGTLATRCSSPLESLDVSANPFREADGEDRNRILIDNLETFPSLLDLVVVACIKANIRPAEEDIPVTVRKYMESYAKCPCGKVCLTTKAILLMPFDVNRVARTLICDDGMTKALFEIVVCSRKCLEKYSNNPFAM